MSFVNIFFDIRLQKINDKMEKNKKRKRKNLLIFTFSLKRNHHISEKIFQVEGVKLNEMLYTYIQWKKKYIMMIYLNGH